MKTSLSLPDLSIRRKISRLSLLQKIYHGNAYLRDSLLSNPSYTSSRVDHPFKIRRPTCKTTGYHRSSLPAAIKDWNDLPPSIASIVDTKMFKSAISDYFLSECHC